MSVASLLRPNPMVVAMKGPRSGPEPPAGKTLFEKVFLWKNNHCEVTLNIFQI